MNYLTNQGRGIHYVESGSGFPVVLLHSLGGSSLDWLYQVDDLVEAGFRVIVPDIAGHGGSSRVEQPITLDELANDVWTILDAIKISQIHVIGLSLGGLIGLVVAAQRPDRIAKLVLISSFSNTQSDAFNQVAAGWKQGFVKEKGVCSWFEKGWPHLTNEPFRQSAKGRQTYLIFHEVAAMGDGVSMAHIIDTSTGVDLSDSAARLPMDILLLSGQDDGISEQMEALLGSLRSGRHVAIPGGKHLVNVDSSDEVNSVLRQFLIE